MTENFIIDGNKVEIEVSQKIFTADLLNVTAFSDRWEKHIHSGFRFLRIEGKQIGKKKIHATFQIIGNNEGVLVLKSVKER